MWNYKVETKLHAIHNMTLTYRKLESRKYNKTDVLGPFSYEVTQENISSSDELEAGLMTLLLLAVHRCSIGAGAGISSFSMSCFSSSMNSRSFMLGLDSVPAGKHVSDTHCWPPQSKPNISSLHPTLYPSDFCQKSASAWLTFMTWFLFRGSRASNLSLNSVNESSLISCSPSSDDWTLASPALQTII